MTSRDKEILLSLARNVIKSRSKNISLNKNMFSQEISVNGGCFVTLTENGELRGCIGYINAILPIYQAVVENAYNAAFGDPRFYPLEESEVDFVKIEISILNNPVKCEFSTVDDLLNRITVGRDGVIIKKQGFTATFLPQVWGQLPKKEDFFSHLCLKAGLDRNEWKKGDIEVYSYQVECFSE